jgi:hypothetical protein
MPGMPDSSFISSVKLRWLPRSLPMKQLDIRLGYQKTIAKSLVIAVPDALIKLLAIPPARQKTPGKWLVMSAALACHRLV